MEPVGREEDDAKVPYRSRVGGSKMGKGKNLEQDGKRVRGQEGG